MYAAFQHIINKASVRVCFVFIFTLFSSVGLGQYYTPAQINTISSTKAGNEGDLYLDTINNKFYIGLTTGRLTIISDSTDEKIDSVRYVNDTLRVYEGKQVIKSYVRSSGSVDSVSLKKSTVDTLKIYTSNKTYSIGLQDLDSTNEKIKSIAKVGDSIRIIEGKDTIYANMNDNDWRINSNTTGLEAAPATNNVASGTYSISAGFNNRATGNYSGILAGQSNISSGVHSFVGGGTLDSVTANNASILGGEANKASAIYSSILGGRNNKAQGQYSSVIGGFENTAYSFGEIVGGLYPTTYSTGNPSSFVATDRLLTIGNGTSTVARSDAFTILKNGNVGIGNNNPNKKLHVAGQVKIDGMVKGTKADSIAVWRRSDSTLYYLPLDSIRTKTASLFFAAEYAGATFDTINGTAGARFGNMTSNNTGSPTFMNYYEWSSSQLTDNSYDVILRFKVPDDFKSWGTNTIANQSQATGSVSVQVRNITTVGTITPLTNVVNAAFTSTTLNLTTLTTNPGDIIVLIITMKSRLSGYSRVGDVSLIYNR